LTPSSRSCFFSFASVMTTFTDREGYGSQGLSVQPAGSVLDLSFAAISGSSPHTSPMKRSASPPDDDRWVS
jgi:hypothetical protein